MDQDPVLPPPDEKLDFDYDTLKAIADVYRLEGNEEYKNKELLNAVYFYTEGLQVNCKDDKLNATLYHNRATAYFYLGNYQETLNDATAAVELEPAYIKAIERGANACVQMQCYEEAISWCEKGLAIDKGNKTLLKLRGRCCGNLNKSQETKPPKMKYGPDHNTVKDQKNKANEVGDRAGQGCEYANLGNSYYNLGDIKSAMAFHERDLKVAKEVGDSAGEGRAYANLGNVYNSLGDFKNAIELHERHLKIAKEVGDRAGEGCAYGNLGNGYYSLGDFKSAKKFYELRLKIAKEVEDNAGEGRAYANLGSCFRSLGDFNNAMEYHKRHLKIAKEGGDRAGEGTAYANLGITYHSLGDFKNAMQCHKRHLKIVKDVRDRAGEGRSYANLGNTYHSLGDFKNAIEYHERHLKIATDIGDRAGEGHAYGNLGNAYHNLGDFKTTVEYHKRSLKLAQELGDRAGEGRANANLGNAYYSLGAFQKAIKYHELDLEIVKEIGDRAGEGQTYSNLGNVYYSMGEFKKAIEYHECHLIIAKEVKDRAGEGGAYANLGNAYHSLGDFKKDIEYHERYLENAKEVGDRAGEGRAYGNLGNAYHSLGDFKRSIEYLERYLKMSKEVGDRAGEARSLYSLGRSFELNGSPHEALGYFYSSVKMFNDLRHRLLFKDEWKISYRNLHNSAYICLWSLLLKRGEVVEALFAAEQGRAQALHDLMSSKYATEAAHETEDATFDTLSCLQKNTVFMAFKDSEVIFWIIRNGNDVMLRKKNIGGDSLKEAAATVIQSLIYNAFENIGVRSDVKCEDRSLDRFGDEDLSNGRSPQTISQQTSFDTNPLRTLYDIIIKPISDLLHDNELMFVPEGPLCLAPYAAFVDSDSKYLCETFQIRVIPSLSSLKLITDASADYHSDSGALLVGDPCLEEVLYRGRKLPQLPYAKAEVEMIGKILHASPLTERQATKEEVLRRLPSVALVHIAAHGRMETGEIALAPNTTRESQDLVEEDYVLTMKDVLSVQLRARLVVLSCCHSARGEIKAEGVVGIARAFLGAGARSVLVSLWAIDDEATLEFMKSFYQHLAQGRSASESLNRAMKCLRDSEQFSEVKYWAPFVLIGDDITLEFGQGD